MAGGSIYFDRSDTVAFFGCIEGKLVWSASADEEAVTSDITEKLYVRRVVTDALDIPLVENCGYQLFIGDAETSGVVSLTSVPTEFTLVATYTRTGISHNSDGSLSIALGGSFAATVSLQADVLETSGSETVDLDAIPVPAAFDALLCSSEYLSGTVTYSYTPRNPAYYYRLLVTAVQGDTSTLVKSVDLGQKEATQQSETFSFSETELSKIYAAFSSDILCTLVFGITTYFEVSYKTVVGKSQMLTLDLLIPEKIAPDGTLTVTYVSGNEWVRSLGIYAEGLSGFSAALSGTPGEGAFLTSKKIVYDGTAYTGDINVSAIGSCGEKHILGELIDSRGRSFRTSESITVLPYSSPVVLTMAVQRGTYDAGWTDDDDGADIRVIFGASLSLADYGNLYAASFKIDGAEVVPDLGVTEKLGSAVNHAVYFFDVTGEYTHIIELRVTDAAGNSGMASYILPTIDVTMEFNESGKGISFGKASEKDAFECDFPSEFYKEVTFSVEGAIKSKIRKSLGIGAELWSGEWSEGTVSVPNLTDYTLYSIGIEGAGCRVLAWRDDTTISGIGGEYLDGVPQRLYSFGAVIDTGDELSLRGIYCIDHAAGGNHTSGEALTVTSVVGIL